MIDGNDGVSAPDAQDSSPESTTQTSQDHLKNVKAEMNRKFSKLTEQISKLVQTIEHKNGSTSPVEETVEAPEVKRYVDQRFEAVKKEEVRSKHESDWKDAISKFPELDENSDSFDSEFFKLADQFYSKRHNSNDPDAVKEAIELAAMRTGKVERLTRDKLLQDEARRSRLISEGAQTSRENKREKEPQLNSKGLARLGIDADKLKARMKANKDKYGE